MIWLALAMLAACANDQILLTRTGSEDAPVPPSATGTGAGPSFVCDPAGPEGPCDCPAFSSCICDVPEEELCLMACNDGNCDMTCSPGAAPCDMSCDTGCIMICQENAFCFASCNGGCTMICEPGSICQLDSLIESSTLLCNEGAACTCNSPLCTCSGDGLCDMQPPMP